MKLYVWSIALLLVIFLSSCAELPPVTRAEAEQALSNPENRLSVTIDSIPSGASIYGYAEGGAGTYIGKTPTTFTYTWIRGQEWGTCIDETLLKRDVIFGSCDLSFRCVLVKDEYKTAIVNRNIGRTNNQNCFIVVWGMRGYSKTFTIALEPVGKITEEMYSRQPPQQQQQTNLAAQAEYEQALAAYNKALEERDNARTAQAMPRAYPNPALGILVDIGAQNMVTEKERALEIARQRLERAKARINHSEW